jgi:hypothetical protein
MRRTWRYLPFAWTPRLITCTARKAIWIGVVIVTGSCLDVRPSPAAGGLQPGRSTHGKRAAVAPGSAVRELARGSICAGFPPDVKYRP